MTTHAHLHPLYLMIAILYTSACTPPEDQNTTDMELAMVDMAMVDQQDSDIDLGSTNVCQTRADCAKTECAQEMICLPCEEGGDCLYSGSIRVYGRAISIQSQSISDLTIRAVCGDQVIEVEPTEGGYYEFSFEVNQCDRLVVMAERETNTEGYVPIIKRFNMPPPVNTIKVDFKLIPGKEIRCDGISCEASGGAYNSYDYGSFYTGYAFNSRELNDISNFGAIFENTNGDLLWLHRFIYRDLRDAQSQTITMMEYNGAPLIMYGLSQLNYETRAWVADLFEGYTALDYHYEENAPRLWEMYSQYLTDPNIDPDGDGQYETIDMEAYQLNFNQGQWNNLSLNGDNLVAHIFAEIEPGYTSAENISSGIFSPANHYVKVPNIYLRGVQTTGTYGPATDDGVDENGRLNTRGLYRRDYTGIPYYGSGIYAVGQPIPKSCWLINVIDNCGEPVFGSQINITGVNHGYRYSEISNQEGQACVEVGRSESENQDFDGDGLSNERFDVEISATSPLGRQRLLPATDRIESTPIIDSDCRTPSQCESLTFTFQNCQ